MVIETLKKIYICWGFAPVWLSRTCLCIFNASARNHSLSDTGMLPDINFMQRYISSKASSYCETITVSLGVVITPLHYNTHRP